VAVGLESLDIEDDAVPDVVREPTPPLGTRVSPPRSDSREITPAP